MITPKEAANAEQFADNFKNMDYVKVPTILWEYTTPQHPGNIAVDDVNGGRLIVYDFGNDGKYKSKIREGCWKCFMAFMRKTLKRFFKQWSNGCFVPTGDMTAVRRTSQFFLNSFEERPRSTKKRERSGNSRTWVQEATDQGGKDREKKQHLAAIGEDLLAIAADQPFRFPATFTFVVRAFSDFRKRWDRQSQAFYNLFRQADRVEKLAQTIQRLEQGDLKLRVRALESERAFQRVAAVQNTIGSMPAIIAYCLCAYFGLKVLIGIVKVKKFDQRERLITGTA
ncbi:UNVERIFIED_CONTAM: protein ACTIVITY OF BC1 COMPLEX kinase, chloroplastic [Sesamum angustifolium]|uniref:Protein ACTIVITY OF BC1 COMPLEX kinase, chloroplastic n=1 Tax=Sesamum angustifolium TaxID=2727405 RepID=A0AAW2RNQ8_9LAMI